MVATGRSAAPSGLAAPASAPAVNPTAPPASNPPSASSMVVPSTASVPGAVSRSRTRPATTSGEGSTSDPVRECTICQTSSSNAKPTADATASRQPARRSAIRRSEIKKK